MLFFKEHKELIENHQTIILCWMPSHIGISGNEAADKATEHALDLPVMVMGIHHEDDSLYIKNYMGRLWRKKWDKCSEKSVNKVQ